MQIVGRGEGWQGSRRYPARHEPDILLLDLKMPSSTASTLLQRMQNQKMKTKIIVLTASDDEGEYVQAMKYGTCGIVLKQTATDLLIKSIRKVYDGEIWLDANTTAAVMRQFASPMRRQSPRPRQAAPLEPRA